MELNKNKEFMTSINNNGLNLHMYEPKESNDELECKKSHTDETKPGM